jgi:hypothetical protein
MTRTSQFLLTALAALLLFPSSPSSVRASNPGVTIDARVVRVPTVAEAVRYLTKNAPNLTPERFRSWSGVEPGRETPSRDIWHCADGTILTTYIESDRGARHIACWLATKQK